MKKKLAAISEKRERLVAQAAEQRVALAENIQPLRSSMDLADKGLNIVRYVRKHPVLMLGIVAIIGLLKPTRAVKWLRRSWVASLVLRGITTWLAKPKGS